MRILLTLVLFIHLGCITGQQQGTLDYILNYQEIAIAEMNRTGIPASIKMAQGILESNSGQSELSQFANNHFGIKCGGQWDGDIFYREDDDFDENGQLMKSCFRSFSSPTESYIAHSEFLRNKKRYEALFKLATQDYKGWARGLKNAGYATDPNYPNKLISVIEDYQLHVLDERHLLHSNNAIFHSDDIAELKEYDGLETGIAIYDAIEIPLEETYAYEDPNDYTEYVKLEPKSSILAKNTHLVASDETMADIAKKYRISLDDLYAYNRLPLDSKPLVGEVLKLDGYIHWGKRPRFEFDSTLASEESEILFENEEINIR